MRHLIGVALAIVMAAVVFFAGSWGYLKLLAGPANRVLPAGGGSLIHDHAVLEGFGALLAVVQGKLIIAQVARRFELQLLTRKSVRPRAGTTMHPSREIRMRIKSRSA